MKLRKNQRNVFIYFIKRLNGEWNYHKQNLHYDWELSEFIDTVINTNKTNQITMSFTWLYLFLVGQGQAAVKYKQFSDLLK